METVCVDGYVRIFQGKGTKTWVVTDEENCALRFVVGGTAACLCAGGKSLVKGEIDDVGAVRERAGSAGAGGRTLVGYLNCFFCTGQGFFDHIGLWRHLVCCLVLAGPSLFQRLLPSAHRLATGLHAGPCVFYRFSSSLLRRLNQKMQGLDCSCFSKSSCCGDLCTPVFIAEPLRTASSRVAHMPVSR